MTNFITSLVNDHGILGIFVGSFLSYSLIPLPTEPILLIGINFFDPYVVLLSSILGSSLGSILNYFIGLKGIRIFLVKRSPKKEKKARKLFKKWGPTSLVLFSWIPVLGDPLTIVAGTLRMHYWKFLLYSTIGKLWYFVLIIWFGSIFF